MSEKVFARGFYWNDPREGAPDFVIGSLSLNREQALGWLESQNANEKGYVRLNVKRGRGGKPYVELDTWQPTKPKQEQRQPASTLADDFDDSADIPF